VEPYYYYLKGAIQMNKKMKEHLTTVVTAIVNEDSGSCKDAFKEYVSLKTQSILLGETSKDDEKVDKDLEKVEKDVKKAKKDQKKDEEDEDVCEKCHCDPCECDMKDTKKPKKDKKDKKDEDCNM
jgi:hypothetical protein